MFTKIYLSFCLLLFSTSAVALTYGISQPFVNLSPFSASSVDQWRLQQLVYDSLLLEIPGQRDVFRAGLAKSWTISKDKKTFDFELRESVWSDGAAVTADDVKFSLDLIQNAAFKSPWLGSFPSIKKVEVLSPTKIRIQAKEINFELFKNIAVLLRVLPKHFYNNPNSNLIRTQILGSGPYKLASFTPSKRVSLEKNSRWWGWKDAELATWFTLEKIAFVTLPTALTVGHSFQSSELDIFPIANISMASELKRTNKSKIYLITDPNRKSKIVEQIYFNLNDILFQTKPVREALYHLIDQKSLCQQAYGTDQKNPSMSSAKGLATLKKEGWADTDKDGVLDRLIKGKKIPFRFSIAYGSQDSEKVLTLLKQQLKSSGIEISLNFLDPSIFWRALQDKKFQAYLGQEDILETVLSSEWSSLGFYNNKSFKLDSVDLNLKKLDHLFDAKQRRQLVKKIRNQIAAETPSLPLCEVDHENYAINSNLQQTGIQSGKPIWGWFKDP